MSDRVSSSSKDKEVTSEEPLSSPSSSSSSSKKDKKKKYERVSGPSSHGTGRVRKQTKDVLSVLEAFKAGDDSASPRAEDGASSPRESSNTDTVSESPKPTQTIPEAEPASAPVPSVDTSATNFSDPVISSTLRVSADRPTAKSPRPTSTTRPGQSPRGAAGGRASIAALGSQLMRQSSIHTLRPKKQSATSEEAHTEAGDGEQAAVSTPAVSALESATTKSADSILKEVSFVLEAAGIGEQDVWEGSIEVFPIVKHYATLIEAASATHTDTIVNFVFPKQPEFKGVPSKTYKIDRRWTITQILNMICKKFEISTPKKYNVTTLRGFTFNETDNLGSYGLGSLLPNWQLKIIKKQTRGLARITTLSKFDAKTGLGPRGEDADDEPAADPEPVKLPDNVAADTKIGSDKKKGKRSKKPASESTPAPQETPKVDDTAEPTAATVPAEERYPVLFIFDSIEFPFKTQRVMLRPSMTVTQVIESLCRAYNVLNPWRFQIQTLSRSILHGESFLNDLGLGSRFRSWQVRLAVKSDPTSLSAVLPELPASKSAWVHITESNLQLDEARRIILELDAKVERLKKKAALVTPAVLAKHSQDAAAAATDAALSAALGGLSSMSAVAPVESAPAVTSPSTPRKSEKKSSRSAENHKLKKEVSALKAQLKDLETENKKLKEDVAAEKLRANREIEKIKTTNQKVALELDSARTVRHKEKELYEKKIKALEGNINETLRMVGTSSSSHQRKGSIFEVFGSQPDKGTSDPATAGESGSSNAGAPDNDGPSALIQSTLALEKAKLDLENFRIELESMKVTHAAEMDALQGEVQLYSSKLATALEVQHELEEKIASLTVEVSDIQKERDELQQRVTEREHHVSELQAELQSLKDDIKTSEEEKTESIKAALKQQFDKEYLDLLEANRDLSQQLADSEEIIESLRAAVQELFDKQDGDYEANESPDLEEEDVVIPAPPPAPAPPPPPAPAPPAPVLRTARAPAVEVVKVEDAEEANPVADQASGNLFDEMLSARQKLKKAGPSEKRNYHSDLQIALQKRFVAMNLDDYEDLEDEEEINSDFDESEESDDDSDTESTSSSVSEPSAVSERDEILFGLQL